MLAAFIRRDLQELATYRLHLVWKLGGLAFNLLGVWFLSRMVGTGGAGLAPYGGHYFPFALVGLALGNAFWAVLRACGARVRYEQLVGTLDAMLAAPRSTRSLLPGIGAWPFIEAALNMSLILAVGLAMTEQSVPANLPAFALAILLTLACAWALSLISGALTLVVKKGEPVTMVFGAVSFLLAGALYPVQVLPPWLQSLADLLPLTHGLEAARQALLTGATIPDLTTPLLILTAMTTAALAAAAFTLRYAERHLMKHGTGGY